MDSSKTHGEYWKNRMEVTLDFLTQYEEDGNNLLEWMITSDESSDIKF